MTVYIMRHGESLASLKRSIFSEMDPRKVPLTQWGYEQTIKTGKEFLKIHNASEGSEKKVRVYYSPHFRIVQSKDGFIQGFGANNCSLIQENECLKEREHGDFDGLHPKLQKEKDPELFRLLEHGTAEEKYITPMPNGESIKDVQTRMEEFIETVVKDCPENEDIVIISHGGNCRLLEQLLTNYSASWLDFEGVPKYGEILKINRQKNDVDASEVIFTPEQRPKSLKNFKNQAYYPALNSGKNL